MNSSSVIQDGPRIGLGHATTWSEQLFRWPPGWPKAACNSVVSSIENDTPSTTQTRRPSQRERSAEDRRAEAATYSSKQAMTDGQRQPRAFLAVGPGRPLKGHGIQCDEFGWIFRLNVRGV